MNTNIATKTSTALAQAKRRANPVDRVAYPATLPIELALKSDTIRNICTAYGLSKEDYQHLCGDPLFLADVERAIEMLKEDGMSFKMKARLQSDALLDRSWALIQNLTGNVPPNVQADLIKHTWRVAGLDASKDQAGNQQTPQLQIVLHLE